MGYEAPADEEEGMGKAASGGVDEEGMGKKKRSQPIPPVVNINIKQAMPANGNGVDAMAPVTPTVGAAC